MVKINKNKEKNSEERSRMISKALLGIFCFYSLNTVSAKIMNQNFGTKNGLDTVSNEMDTVSVAKASHRTPYISDIKVDENNNVKVTLGNIKEELAVKITVFNYDKSQKDKYTFGNREVVVVSGSKNYFDMNFIALDPNNESGDFWIFMEFSNGTKVCKRFYVNPAVL